MAWEIFPQPGTETVPRAVEALSANQWTTREFPKTLFGTIKLTCKILLFLLKQLKENLVFERSHYVNQLTTFVP